MGLWHFYHVCFSPSATRASHLTDKFLLPLNHDASAHESTQPQVRLPPSNHLLHYLTTQLARPRAPLRQNQPAYPSTSPHDQEAPAHPDP